MQTLTEVDSGFRASPAECCFEFFQIRQKSLRSKDIACFDALRERCPCLRTGFLRRIYNRLGDRLLSGYRLISKVPAYCRKKRTMLLGSTPLDRAGPGVGHTLKTGFGRGGRLFRHPNRSVTMQTSALN